jgi:hypothetical protein
MEIRGDNYHVVYDPASANIALQGFLRLRGMSEYAPIMQLLDGVVAAAPETITLSLQGLRFLNSSGINMLFRFVINMRDQTSTQVVVHGSSQIPWQVKSLRNLQRLMPGLQLDFE